MRYNVLLVIITIIFSIIILFTSIKVFNKKKYNFLVENIVAYISYLIFLIVQYKLKFQVMAFIIMLVLITIIANNLIGDCLNVYNHSKYYDRFLHAFGSFSFSLFFYSILDKITVQTIYPKFYISTFVASIGISLGCIFEIYEFILDSTTNSNNQHGLTDTNFDLISDVIGAVIAGIVSISIFL